jgi:FG-GAP repeat
MNRTRSWQRVLALGVTCVVAAAITPAGPKANDGAWATTAIPQATLEVAGKGSGLGALSSDGRTAVVAGTKRVCVFRASSAGSWVSTSKPAATLRLPKSALANVAGVATSANGTTILVAAGAVGNTRAATYVFRVSSPRAWTPVVTPTATLTNAAEPAGFGSGVALSADGRTALIGELAGADVFHVATASSWRNSSNPTATLVADPIGAEAGGLGIAVALSADGTTALIGATNLSTFIGAAYIFRATAADAWVSTATPAAVLTDGAIGLFGDGFGGSVALSLDGVTAVVGAPNLAFGPAGAAYVFNARSQGAWTTTADPDAVVGQRSGGKFGQVPGWSVALSDEGTALVGDPSLAGEPGAAVVLRAARAHRSWQFDTVSHARLTNAASPPGDLLGASVSLSADGTTALVSSVRASFVFTQSGSRTPTRCYVPYVHGETLLAARRAIESTHCQVGEVTPVGASGAQSDHVISQTRKPGARLPRGTKVGLRIARRF